VARAEVELAEEKEQLQQLELNELQRQRNEVMAQIEAIQDEHRQRLIPQIEQLQVVRSNDVTGIHKLI
jgi:seryl-tRNA synthetase